MRASRSRFVLFVAMLSLVFLVSLADARKTAWAESGVAVTAPNPKLKAIHGVKLTIDTRWVEGRGYRPVRITANATKSVNYDRNVMIQFSADDRYYRANNPDITVTKSFVIPAGALVGKTVLSVPQFNQWNQIGWLVYIDDDYADELSVPVLQGISSGSWYQAEPRVLYVEPNTKVLKAVDAPIPEQPSRRRFPVQVATNAGGRFGPMAVEVAPQDLPTSWIDYSCVDFVQLTLAELSKLIVANPDAWHAIRRWVGAGGNLVVYDIKNESRVGDIEEFFGLNTEAGGSPKQRGWRVDREQINVGMNDRTSQDTIVSGEPAIAVSEDEIALYDTRTGQQLRKLSEKAFWRPYRLGSIVASVSEKRIDYENSPHYAVPAIDRQLWPIRHGTSFQYGTNDFWDFLIPDVGLAPVGAFRILITVFVIAIGPVNYWLLRRWRRLHLLLITVPVSAALVTFALFAYAILSDGFGTRVRVRSFTEIDQRDGEALCWSRRTYYCGLTPRAGIRLPTDVMVSPMTTADNRSQRFAARYLDWGDQQLLLDGWIKSRNPTQMMTVRARTSDRKILVRGDGESLQVANQLGTRIEKLLVRYNDGAYHWGENIDADGRMSLEPAELATARDNLQLVFNQRAPRFPDEWRGGDQVFGISSGRRYYYGYRSGDFYNPTTSRSRLEWAMTTYGPSGDEQPPGSYLAIVERSPELELGIAGAVESGSLHVVFGRF